MTLKDRAARIIAVDRADYDFAMSIRACHQWRASELMALKEKALIPWGLSFEAYQARMAEIDREWKQRLAQVCAHHGKDIQ